MDSANTSAVLATAITMIVSYLICGIPFGKILVGLMSHKDIQKEGSGNIGTTNALRVGGPKVAALTLAFDLLKGMVCIIVFRDVVYAGSSWSAGSTVSYPLLVALVALACLYGHIFSPYSSSTAARASPRAWHPLRLLLAARPYPSCHLHRTRCNHALRFGWLDHHRSARALHRISHATGYPSARPRYLGDSGVVRCFRPPRQYRALAGGHREQAVLRVEERGALDEDHRYWCRFMGDRHFRCRCRKGRRGQALVARRACAAEHKRATRESALPDRLHASGKRPRHLLLRGGA